MKWHWVGIHVGVVHQLYALGIAQQLAHLGDVEVVRELHVHRLAVATGNGNTHCGGCNADRRVKDLLRLPRQLHLLLSIAVVQELVATRQHIAVDGVGIRPFAFPPVAFILQLLHGFHAGSGDALVGAHHHALHGVSGVQGGQGHYELDGAAIGISDNAALGKVR